MKKFKRASILLIAAVCAAMSLGGCGSKAANDSGNSEGSLSSLQLPEAVGMIELPSEDTDDEAGFVKTLYNPNFSIELMDDGIKKVTDGDGRELVLVPRSLGDVPDEYSDSLVIRTPVENAVFLSDTQVCTFRTVDYPELISHIGGVSGGADTWSDITPISAALESGEILNVGGDGMGDPDFELIQSLEPDIVFIYGGEFGQQNIMEKLDELGINYAVDNDYLESDYLARMEWMRFLLTFFDDDDSIDKIMDGIKRCIDEIKSGIDGLDKPKAAIFNIYGGTVYATDGASWVGSMVADMGADSAFEGVPVINITYETAYECISDADVIIYSGIAGSMEELADVFPQITECKAYENDRVYRYSDDFWHSIDNSDIVAADMAAVFYPEVFPGRELRYLVHIDK